MISVVIPTYNRANYILECINCVFNQTYKDYEIIVVDDGSTDNTKGILRPYMDKIKYIYQNNGGAAKARNTGIKNASGEYIAWLDSDDKWPPFKLELQMQVFKKLPNIGLVFSDFSCFTNENGKIAESYIREYFYVYDTHNLQYDMLFSHKASLRDLNIDVLGQNVMVYWVNIFEKLILGQMFPTGTVMIKKECIDETGLFNESYKSGEAYDFHARIARQWDVAFIDYPMMDYRRFHAGQLSALDMEVESNLAWLDAGLKLWYNDKEYFKANKKIVSLGISQFYFGLGTAYFKKKEYDKALPNFLKSIKLNFKQKKVYLNTAAALLKSFTKKRLGEEMKEQALKNSFLERAKGPAANVLHYAGLMAFIKNKMVYKEGFKILAYHGVTDTNNGPQGMNMSISAFEDHLKCLRTYFRPVSFRYALNLLKENTKVPNDIIVVTFDDGYKDNYTNAFPLLRKYEIPATIFLSVEPIDKEESLWFDVISNAFKNTKKQECNLNKIIIKSSKFNSDKDKTSFADLIISLVKKLNKKDTECFINYLLHELEVHNEEIKSLSPMLNWEDVIKMKNDGIEFGSHGMSHTILSNLSREEIEYEVVESKKIIKERTNIDVDLFAYPNGGINDFSQEIKQIIKNNGYVCSSSLIAGSNNISSDCFALKRFCITQNMISGPSAFFEKPLYFRP